MPETKFRVEIPGGKAALVADFDHESYCLDLKPVMTHSDHEYVDKLLASLHLEMMDEDECPSELLPDGGVRVWCAKVDGL